nr:MAG TPA: ChiA1-BD-binding domain protein [Caudoviricetes sp.]
MKKCVNGEIIDMTAEEIAELEEAKLQYEAAEKHRPLTVGEVGAMLIKQQINTLTVDDQTALRMIAFYPDWVNGKAYAAGDKLVSGGKLYKVLQAHTSQSTWVPGAAGTESLYARIDEEHDGTKYDPIPYNGNMALENGKYYTQGDVLYKCTRDTGNPVYNTLAELVGLYVEEVSDGG